MFEEKTYYYQAVCVKFELKMRCPETELEAITQMDEGSEYG